MPARNTPTSCARRSPSEDANSIRRNRPAKTGSRGKLIRRARRQTFALTWPAGHQLPYMTSSVLPSHVLGPRQESESTFRTALSESTFTLDDVDSRLSTPRNGASSSLRIPPATLSHVYASQPQAVDQPRHPLSPGNNQDLGESTRRRALPISANEMDTGVGPVGDHARQERTYRAMGSSLSGRPTQYGNEEKRDVSNMPTNAAYGYHIPSKDSGVPAEIYGEEERDRRYERVPHMEDESDGYRATTVEKTGFDRREPPSGERAEFGQAARDSGTRHSDVHSTVQHLHVLRGRVPSSPVPGHHLSGCRPSNLTVWAIFQAWISSDPSDDTPARAWCG